jgi:hypothetical protein
MRKVITAAIAIGALTACGGGGGNGPTGPITLDDLAARAHCTIMDRAGDALTPTAGDCRTASGATLEIATFTDHSTRDAWLLFVRSTGGEAESGDLWAVSGSDKPSTEAAATAIRG